MKPKAELMLTRERSSWVMAYTKSDADRYIGELESMLEDACLERDDNQTAIDELVDELRHQKYKRCLAMAKIASDAWHLHNSFYLMGHQNFELKKCERYERHRLRWLALADKFKEAE